MLAVVGFGLKALAVAPSAHAEAPALDAAARAIRSSVAVGTRAPVCDLTALPAAPNDFSSEAVPPIRARRFEGRVTLIDFWASWCPTCEHAFGFLDSLARDYRGAGLDVLAVNLDGHRRDALAFLADRARSGRTPVFELAREDTGRCPRGFGLVGMPQAFLIDREGRIRAVTRGFRSGEARALRELIEALLTDSDSPLPAVAADSANRTR